MFENSSHGLTGDIVIESNSLSGFPYYQEMIDAIVADRARVEAAVPTIDTFGLINIENRKTARRAGDGLPDRRDRARSTSSPNRSTASTRSTSTRAKAPPAEKTFDLHRETDASAVDELPEDLKFDPSTGRPLIEDKALAGLLRYANPLEPDFRENGTPRRSPGT